MADGERAAAIQAVVDDVAELPKVEAVTDPTTQPSPDGSALLAIVQYDVELTDLTRDDLDGLWATGAPARDAGVQVEVGGELPQYVEQPETGAAELIGLLAAVVILLLAFGSVLAMGLPIGIALFGLGISVFLLTLLAAVVEVPTTTPILASMIGIGVGIDYALFVVTRHREHLHDGMTVRDAVGPGHRHRRPGRDHRRRHRGHRHPRPGHRRHPDGHHRWASARPSSSPSWCWPPSPCSPRCWASPATASTRSACSGGAMTAPTRCRSGPAGAPPSSRRPWPYLVGSLAVLLTLTLPLFSIRFGQTDSGTMSTDSTQRQAYDLVAEAYGPGVNGPLLLAVESSDPAVVDEVVQAVTGQEGVVFVAPPQISEEGDAAIVPVISDSEPQAEGTSDLIHHLRNDVLPTVDAEVHVGGLTATFVDMSDLVANRLPWFIGAVVGLSFLLLMVVFRSILVPLKAALMNLLSIGAAYGVIVAVFQWGWGKDLVGLEQTVPIVAFVPMMMFAILFGLSMDYEVFLLSRIREAYQETHDNTGSVISGITSTARVITSAALIMIAVFLGFVLGEDPVIKMTGLGLATAVFIDATIVRVVLVPATMRLLGDANWWLPGWLDRLLPHIDVEGGHGLPEPEYEDRVAAPPKAPELVDA